MVSLRLDHTESTNQDYQSMPLVDEAKDKVEAFVRYDLVVEIRLHREIIPPPTTRLLLSSCQTVRVDMADVLPIAGP